MTIHIKDHRDGFPMGNTSIVRHQDDEDQMPISLAVLKLSKGTSETFTADTETAYLLMSGKVDGRVGDKPFDFSRGSLFDESASCLHVAAGTEVVLNCSEDTEFTIYACDNLKGFEARVFNPSDVANEPRGKGQVGDRCLRYVRTIFDGTNSDPNALLVLGEVITSSPGPTPRQ